MKTLEDSRSLLLGLLHAEGFVDMWDNTTTGNGSLDQGVELFITSNGEQQVSWCDSLHLKILGSVSSKLKDLGCEILKNGGAVHG